MTWPGQIKGRHKPILAISVLQIFFVQFTCIFLKIPLITVALWCNRDIRDVYLRILTSLTYSSNTGLVSGISLWKLFVQPMGDEKCLGNLSLFLQFRLVTVAPQK